MKWEQTFEFSAPVDRVWQAFADPSVEFRVWDPDNAYQSGGAVKVDFLARNENELLEWEETERQNKWKMSVSFEEIGTGTRVTIVTSGFGEGDEWKMFGEGRRLGWEHMLQDLEVFFRTGVMMHRLYTTPWGKIGVGYVGDGGGVRILSVAPDSLAARAGLEVDDVIVRVDELPIYGVSDFWMVERVVDLEAGAKFEYIRDAKLVTSSGPFERTEAAASK